MQSKDKMSKVYKMNLWLTSVQSGCGFLPRQKLERVQVELRIMDNLELSSKMANKGGSAPFCNTKSRQRGLSPAILPSAHTAYSKNIISYFSLSFFLK